MAKVYILVRLNAFMKTTIILEEKMYKRLVNQAISKYGSAKNISLTINDILKSQFSPRSSMFGKLPRIELSDLREENDRTA